MFRARTLDSGMFGVFSPQVIECRCFDGSGGFGILEISDIRRPRHRLSISGKRQELHVQELPKPKTSKVEESENTQNAGLVTQNIYLLASEPRKPQTECQK